MYAIAGLLLALALLAPPIIGEPFCYGPQVWVPIATQG